MPNETELAILSRLMRKILQIDSDFNGNKTLRVDFKSGNICGMTEVSGIESVDLWKLK